MASDTAQPDTSCPLSWLLADLLPNQVSSLSVKISGMTLDSRAVTCGDLFVAVQGAVSDGRQFIDNAIASGAAAVLSETLIEHEDGKLSVQGDTPVIHIFQLQQKLSAIAMRFYFPQSNLHHVTAVTGTNGKTTIASLLANSYMLLGQQSAQMGTIGNGLYNQLQASLNTTLDAISVCRELASYQAQGATQTIMEVSSHGLVQGRIAAVPFNTAIFTNLTRDHLDYHGTMHAYAEAKQTLFDKFPLKHRIINANDAVGRDWLAKYPDAIAYGLNIGQSFTKQHYFNVTKVDYLPQGLAFEFASSWGAGIMTSPFYGDFNVLNMAAVSCALLADGVRLNDIQKVMAELTVVPGRMEQYFFAKQQITFVVDYAHTPDALDNSLQALQHHKQQGRIIAVFGCGGDRDKGKRPLMASVAEQGADLVVIVDDNPRSEEATLIVEDIKAGLTKPEKALVIHERQQAIQYLLANAQQHDIVLLAGKGHEDYQIFGDKKVHYSDRETLQALVKEQAIQDNTND